MNKIIKRDGRQLDFDKMKIVDAVLAAFYEVDGKTDDYALIKAGNIADYIADIAVYIRFFLCISVFFSTFAV